MKYVCKQILWTLLTCTFAMSLTAQTEHAYKGTLSAQPELEINHRRGDVQVLEASDGKISWEAIMSFSSNNEESTRKMKEYFKVKAEDNGGKASISTTVGIKNMQTINGRSSITFNDGTKVKGIKDLEVKLIVYTPALARLNVNNKYEEIEIRTPVSELLTLSIYSGEVHVQDIQGKLNMNAKYSKGSVGKNGGAKVELYESKIDFGATGDLDINAKYSTFRIPEVGALKAVTYESKGYLGDVSGTLQLNDKYSRYEMKNIQNALLDLYETELQAETAADIQGKSKYTVYEIRTMGALALESSYEDEFQIGQLKSLKTVSKYGNYTLGQLSEALIMDSYEDEVDIEELNSGLQKIQIKGKYTNLDLTLPNELQFNMEVNARYTDLDVGEGDLDFSKYISKGSELNFVGKTKGAGTNAAQFKIECYECKLKMM